MNPRLVRVADDNQLWAEIYGNEFEAIFEVQSRIAAQVAAQLDIALTGSEQNLMNARPTENVVAYQFYLRGIDRILFGHQPEENYHQAQRLFEQAVAIDPDFALAYSKLSESHRGLYFFGYEHTVDRLDMTKQAIDKELELDPSLPKVQRQLGYYYYQGLLDYERVLEQFANVAKVLPNDARLLQDISYIWRRQGRIRETLAHQLSAFEMNPTAAGLCIEIAHTYAVLRMRAESLFYCDRAIDMAPENNWDYFLKAIVHVNGSGDVGAAKTALNLCPDLHSNVLIWTQYYLAILERDYAEAHEHLGKVNGDVILMQSGYLPVSMLQGLTYIYQEESARRGGF